MFDKIKCFFKKLLTKFMLAKLPFSSRLIMMLFLQVHNVIDAAFSKAIFSLR